MNLPKFSVNKPVTITMMVLIIVVFGFISFFRLGLDMLPDIEYPMVSIITTYTGVAGEDVEEVITKPIEDAVSTVSGVKSVSSISQEGLSAITVEFNNGTNVDFAAQDVRDKLGLIEDYLPDDANKPLVVKMDVGAMPIIGYGVTADSLDTLELRKLLLDNVKDKLERLDGVASVELQGGRQREILVELNQPLLDAYGINQEQIIRVLRTENINLSGGFIEEGLQELPLRTVGEFKTLSEIENLVIINRENNPVYLKDVARVSDTYQEQRGYSRTNKKEGILLLVNKQSGANTDKAVKAVKQKLEKLQRTLPQDINFSLVMDQSRIIKTSTDSVANSGLVGGLLAMLVIYLFLRNWRPTLAIGLAIPLSLVATFIPLYIVGYTLNLMTLAGLSLGVGMLVDNAVVVIENIYRHLEGGHSRKKAAVIGSNEVALAITASTLTTIAVFLPMSLGSGVAGQLSRGLSLTIIFALSSSLFVALTLVPMIASKIFKKRKKATDYRKASGQESFEMVKRNYKKLLIWSLNHRVKTILAAVVLLFLTLALTPFIGKEFMPPSDQSILIVQVEMPVGTSLTETDNATAKIEDILLDKTQNSLVSVTSFVGQNVSDAQANSMGMGGGINEATIMVRLKDKKDRALSADNIKEIVRINKPRIKGLKLSFMDMSGLMMGGALTPIEIKIFGKDLGKLKSISQDISQKIVNVNGLRDINTTYKEGKPELNIKIDREKASYLGLTVGQIAATVKNSMQGVVATQLRVGGEETDIRVRYAKKYRDTLQKVTDLTIVSPAGSQIPLKQVATITRSRGPIKIYREDQLRVVSVTADIIDRDVGSIVKDIKEKLSDYNLPSGYFIEYGGSQKQINDTFGTLAWALALGVLLVYMVMASQFESLIHPFIVMFEIPLAFIGVGMALFLTRQSLSLPSFMGIIMLSGIVVNNAIVLIDYVNQLRKKGMSKFDALVTGGTDRLRPILITSITTILGMLPMAISRQEGSELIRPMAIAVIGGLLVSTMLTLIIIPVIYSLVEKFSKRFSVKINQTINGNQ